MGLSTRQDRDQIFTDRWICQLSKAVERWMPARVEFLDPTTQTEILVDVPARIQPIRSSVERPNYVNDTHTQTVLVSIPIHIGRTLDLRPKHRARVTSAPNMPILENYLFVVQETLDSANAVERTFYFTVDLEVKVV